MSGPLARVATAAALALLGALTGAPAPATAGIADRIGATFQLMADDFLKAFAPIEAVVVAYDGHEIFLDVTAAGGAQAGQEFTIYRKGAVFVHPFTQRPLGRFEEVLGHAQIKRLHPQFSVAVYIPLADRPAPLPEDGARITRGRIRVAITPVLDLTVRQADTRRVPYLMATVLESSRRFQVVDPLVIADMFASGAVSVEEMFARPERAVRAAKNLDVAGWLIPMLIERRGVTYLDATYISAVTGAALFSQRQPLVPEAASEEQRFPWEPKAED
ncbi:MAG: hypothetical protein ACRELS_16535 [Candidatus Rokuibacteriota bacterium]